MALGPSIALATERVVASIEGMHRAIAGRWFAALSPTVRPVQMVHDAVSNLVYESIRLGGAAVGSTIATRMTIEPSTDDAVRAFVNGLWGDELGRHEKQLSIAMGAMGMRDRTGNAAEVPPTTTPTHPPATGRLVVLVHGLIETERCWQARDDRPGLAEVLEDDPALTPVSIRYNTGLRVSANGSRLSLLLDELESVWPVPVESIALVGHSMGGLVIRSACGAARAAGHDWIDHVTDVVTLGTPHRGAPLEKLTNALAWGLHQTAETRPLADFLNARSAGIKDLRFGAITDADWKGFDPDALLRNTVGDHSLPEGIDHHFVTGVVTTDPAHPVGVVVGDLIVPAASGSGRPRLDPTTVVVLGGMRHRDLLNEPAVIDRVMGWLSQRRDEGIAGHAT
jgi:hypothetical protein